MGILFAYVTVTRLCPVNPHVRRAVCTQTKEAAHWSQVRAPIRRRRSFHADMHGKREAAQVIGTMMGSLSRVRIAKFDARPTCTPTFSGARSVKFVSSGPELKLPTEKLRRSDAAESGEDAWVGLQLSGGSPAASRPCRSDIAPAYSRSSTSSARLRLINLT